MQPYLFPYIGYFQLINIVDKFVLLDDVNFTKKSWVNRNSILVKSNNGYESHLFSMPLANASQNIKINEVNRIESSAFNKKFLATIVSSYSKAPFFNDVFEMLTNIMSFEEANIAKFIYYSLQKVCEFIGIKTPMQFSNDIEKDQSLRGQQRILEICSCLKAQKYINPVGGLELYTKDDFLAREIDLLFLKTHSSLSYPQWDSRFIANLSVLDILMFVSKPKIGELLTQFDFISPEGF